MALQDNPLTNIHPEYQKIYTDLLNRLTQAQSDLSTNVLRKDKADITPYTISIAPSVSMTDAVQKQQLVGGLLRPYRNFKSVTTAATGATVKTGQDAVITDVLNLGCVYKITLIRVTTVVRPLLASTITVKANGNSAYTYNIALTDLPVLGKSIELLGFTNQYPADLTLPCTLTCTASSGTFDVFIDGVLV